MRKPLVLTLVAGLVVALCVALTTAPASPAPAAPGSDSLDVYTATLTQAQLPAVAKQGLDIADQRRVGDKVELDVVLDKRGAAKLEAQGVDVRLKRVKGGKTVRQLAAAQAVGGFNVWRSYDEA